MFTDFNKDSYDTPENRRHFIWDYIFLKSSLYFLMRMIYVVYHFNKVIRKKGFSVKAWREASSFVFRSVEGCGGKVHIKGMNNIDVRSGPVVFIGNHMSTLETFMLPGIICPKKNISYVVKKSLIDYPLFGLIMRATNPIVVSREDPVKDFKTVLNEGKKILESGNSVVIFPQQTRGSDVNPKDFNSIGIKLAKKNNVPVVPMAIKTDFWGNGKLIKDLGKVSRSEGVYLEFGKPMDIEGNGKAEHEKIIAFIQDRLSKWNKKENPGK